mmetsp:Transcript_20267/g.59243  ORF Transcript_20267/g.59243 Transcript_20267/m.59243 type:complete len:251 (+) Transcript_20267:464-1216(+)
MGGSPPSAVEPSRPDPARLRPRRCTATPLGPGTREGRHSWRCSTSFPSRSGWTMWERSGRARAAATRHKSPTLWRTKDKTPPRWTAEPSQAVWTPRTRLPAGSAWTPRRHLAVAPHRQLCAFRARLLPPAACTLENLPPKCLSDMQSRRISSTCLCHSLVMSTGSLWRETAKGTETCATNLWRARLSCSSWSLAWTPRRNSSARDSGSTATCCRLLGSASPSLTLGSSLPCTSLSWQRMPSGWDQETARL